MCSLREKKTSIRSTGYRGIAFNVTICGDAHAIPTRLKRRRPQGSVQRANMVNAFSISPIGCGDYFGFELSGDGLFLLGDFTVTHNTAIQQCLARSAAPLPTLFFELELPQELMFERFVQMETAWTSEHVEAHYTTQTGGLWRTFEHLNHILVCAESGLSTAQIESFIGRSELKTGTKPAVVIIDYIGLIRGEASRSRYEKLSATAEELKVIAKRTRTIVVLGTQVARPEKSKDSLEPRLHDAKDSGSIENSAGLVLGAWRPDHQTLMIKVLKNTKGRSGIVVECNFDGETMQLTERDQRRFS